MKTIFITGVNSGLGNALFNQFLAKGYFVYGLLRNREEYYRLNASLPNNAQLIHGDISEENVVSIIQNIVKNKPIDLLINNAGIAGKSNHLKDVDTNEISKVFDVHCVGALLVTKALEGNLLVGKDPIVININSRLGSIARQSNGMYKDLTISYAYRIAKAAQNMLTNCLRVEFNGKIKFISLHPGTLKTDIAQPDANLSPDQSAERIIDAWSNGKLHEENGIIDLPDAIIQW